MENLKLEPFLKLKLNQLSGYLLNDIELFRDFYDDIFDERLKEIFSILHCKLNELLAFMNYKNTPGFGGHYNAHQSRELMEVISHIDSLQTSFQNGYELKLDHEYKIILEKCKTFLSNRGGSKIPEDFPYITIIENRPIFIIENKNAIQINNPFLLAELKFIGEGSYAKVFKYKDPFYGYEFVVKRARDDLRTDELERFRKEFETLKKLNSPYIIKVYRYDNEKNEYIMEFADETLKDYILRNNANLTFSRRKNLILQLLKAFEYIHKKGYLHRDISYNNLLIKHFDDDTVILKVSDFGLVKFPDSTLTRQGTTIKGALNDYSDLNRVGFENYEIRHETYALSKVIYFILTGKQSNYEKEKNRELREFILRGISPNKNERFSSIEEIKNELVNRVFVSVSPKD